jgi:hypothetical protein
MGGLRFLNLPPEARREIRLWLEETNAPVVDQRIQATGELAWTNRTKTTGGLRFTGLSAEARQQVRDWTS